MEAVLDVPDAQRDGALGVLTEIRLALDPGQSLACDQVGMWRGSEPTVAPPSIDDEPQGLGFFTNKNIPACSMGS
eukprot:9242393-Pyramimonas_sp.AAC.1